MKMLYLVRHAEAAAAANDHERPLTPAGTLAATMLGRLLADDGTIPDVILSSDARRTRETVAAMATSFPAPVQTDFVPALYEATARDLLEAVRGLGESSAERVMLVGHNPAIGDLVRILGHRGKPEAVARALRGHPPGALAMLRVACHEWGDLWPGAAELWRFVVPDDIRAQPSR